MMRPGPRNLITDVEGLLVGNAEDWAVNTGVTVVTAPGEGWIASADIRGGGPGVRETPALDPENLVGRAHAIVLSGGSVYGLAAADGAVAKLASRGVGLRLKPSTPPIPIVPAAVLHDLSAGGDKDWGEDPPYRRLGAQATVSARADFALGSVGAGAAAMAGLRKGGLGSASLDLGDGLVVGALVAANPVGSVYMPDGETFWAWPFELEGEFGGRVPKGAAGAIDPMPNDSKLANLGRLNAGANTTLGIVATNADLTTAECKRFAMMAQDGLARAVRPAHTPFDGDIVFGLASGARPIGDDQPRPRELARLGSAAADCLARAIARAVYHAIDRAGPPPQA